MSKDNESRPNRIAVQVNDEEEKVIEEAAKWNSLPTAIYVRQLAVRAAREHERTIGAARREVA